MFHALQVVTVAVVAVAMALSLAHALELPGKYRLGREHYLAVQAIYYPGFTYGGASEPLGIALTLVLLAVIDPAIPSFWLMLGALITLIAAHAIFWLITQPVNKFWLADEKLGAAGQRFFAIEKARDAPAPDWTALRDRWEYSHVARAVLCGTAFILLLVAVVV